MVTDVAGAIAWILMLALFATVVWRVRNGRGHSGSPGPGAAGMIYGMLNEDKRNAVEIIVEERAAERRPEYPDGNLPDLESPVRREKPGLRRLP